MHERLKKKKKKSTKYACMKGKKKKKLYCMNQSKHMIITSKQLASSMTTSHINQGNFTKILVFKNLPLQSIIIFPRMYNLSSNSKSDGLKAYLMRK